MDAHKSTWKGLDAAIEAADLEIPRLGPVQDTLSPAQVSEICVKHGWTPREYHAEMNQRFADFYKGRLSAQLCG